MTDEEKFALLVALRKAFRAARPDLKLPPAGKPPTALQSQREALRQRLLQQKRESIEQTAAQHPETIARVIRQLLEKSRRK